MIKARHSKLARIVFNPYLNRLLRKGFSSFTMYNRPEDDPDKGLIITPNHFSWWDGFFLDYSMRAFSKRNIYIMMLESQLKRYGFFKYTGAYSIDQNNAKKIIESLEYTRAIISDNKNFAAVYPQGEIEPYDKSPLTIRHGLKKLLINMEKKVNVIPAAFKIQYEDKKLPAVYGRFGGPLSSEDITRDFDVFKNSFYDNIVKLNDCIIMKKTGINLFDRKGGNL